MKQLSEFLIESFQINEGESIKNEKDFRAAAEAKFKKVFGDKLDKDKMNNVIDGLLKDNDNVVKDGNWGQLIGMLNKSFGESLDADKDSLVTEAKAPKLKTMAYDYNGEPCEVVAIFNPKRDNIDKFISTYDESGAMEDELENWKDSIIAGRISMVAVDRDGETAVYVWGPEGVCYENK